MSIAIERITQQGVSQPGMCQPGMTQMDGQGDQFLTFVLGGGEYGVDILRVQEIKGWDVVTPLPNTPDYMRGVINLRGVIVPIIDLRCRFGMARIELSKTTVVIVLKVHDERGERTMGFVVDAVSDVYSISDSQLRPPPDICGTGQTNFVKSLATVDGKMIVLLDIDRLAADQFASLTAVPNS